VALLLVAVLVTGGEMYRAVRAYNQLDQTFITFRTMPDTYLRIAGHLESSIGELNAMFFRYTTGHNRADWERFERKSQELSTWLSNERKSSLQAKVITIKPAQIVIDIGASLDEISTAFDAYLAEARRVANEPATAAGSNENSATPDKLLLQSAKMVNLVSQARTQGQAIQTVASTSSKLWLASLQRTLREALLVLAVFSVWLMVIAYIRVVSPLRRGLIERDTIIERQQKMAHFGELAADVAHEVKNPLTAILLRLYTLQKTLTAGTPAYEDAFVIRNEIDRLNRIVNDFLQLARPAEPHLATVVAEPLLLEMRDLFAPQCERQSIQLNVESANGTRFVADAQQMKQVLINLIQNAADSIEVEGTITLRARLDTRRLDKRTSEVVVLEVQDTGMGIPPDVQKRLFDPFFSTKKGGTGLGLSIAAKIVNNHHGKLEIQTQPGQGTTFSVVLPADQKPS
jgi:signal transduction histidine kinase